MAKRGASKSENSKPKRYVFTAAQSNYYEWTDPKTGKVKLLRWGGNDTSSTLQENLYKGFQTFCAETGAELKILPIQGKGKKEDVLHESVKDLPEVHHMSRKYEKLNSNLTLGNIRVPPQNVDPTASRMHLASKYRATILFPHAKQRLRAAASFQSQLPRFLATTGCITNPNYNIGNDRGDQAMEDHVLGGIYVEVKDNKFYNMRFLTAQKDGKFIDLGKKFDGYQTPKKAGVEALVLGDIHWGEHDEDSMASAYEEIEFFKPKRLILHDFFSGYSISHHELKNKVSRARKFEEGRLSLEEELVSNLDELKKLSKMMGTRPIYLAHSNHHDFLKKYIESEEWMRGDLWNMIIGGRIVSQLPEDDTYLLESLKLVGDIPSNVTFLRADEDLKVWGYQLASHGHLGNNGARGGNAKTRESNLGKGISGHNHAPETFRDSHIVGTNSLRDLPYTHGSASSAMAADGVLYNNGQFQMILKPGREWK